MDEMQIRWAKREEWKAAMTMVWNTFLEFEGKEYSKEGIQNFFEFVTDDKIYQAFLKGLYQMIVAVKGGRIIGVATVRNGHHLSLLFVDKETQHKGVGSALIATFCKYLYEEAGEKVMTVKAAPSAVDFYKKLGFQLMGPMEEYTGVVVYPMEYQIGN